MNVPRIAPSAAPPTARPAAPAIPEPAPETARVGPAHSTTPTGRPSWYGRELAREDRPFWSRTGDVSVRAGNTFGIPHSTVAAALDHAKVAAGDGQGAVLVLAPTGDDVHAGQFYLARGYNVEHRKGDGYVVERSRLLDRPLTHLHPEVRFVVDGETVVATSS